MEAQPSVTDLKVKLLEVITVLLAVLFLKGVLTLEGERFEWVDLVIPFAVVAFGFTTWLIRAAHRD